MGTAWIIEDDREISYSISLMMKLMGHQSQIFVHPRGPMLMMHRNVTMPDLIILDINLPEVSGLEVLKFIRSKRRWDHIIVIMNSVDDSPVTVNKAMNLGADGYIYKPFTIEDLESEIQQAYKKRERP
jgi:DNA-binding response OmpR family regulator